MRSSFHALTVRTQAALQRSAPLLDKYGLTLSETDAIALTRAREKALSDTGRVEFGAGVLEALIYAFCDSPYVVKEEFGELLCALTESFYWFKNEADGDLSDEELIDLMRTYFDDSCRGSVDYMNDATLLDLSRGRDLPRIRR